MKTALRVLPTALLGLYCLVVGWQLMEDPPEETTHIPTGRVYRISRAFAEASNGDFIMIVARQWHDGTNTICQIVKGPRQTTFQLNYVYWEPYQRWLEVTNKNAQP